MKMSHSGFFLILASFLLLVAGCEKEVPSFEIGDTAEIDFKKSIQYSTPDGPITIAYKDMLSDSRCPVRETSACIWGGRAEISVSINNEAPMMIALGDLETGANPHRVNTLPVSGYTLQLMDVENGQDHHVSDKKKSNIEVMLY